MRVAFPERHIGRLVDENTDQASLLIDQRAGRQIGDVVQLFRNLKNLQACLLGNRLVVHIVQHITYRCNGDVGLERNIFHGHFLQNGSLLKALFMAKRLPSLRIASQ
ncbi:hypothetical protein D3C71_1474630 [compost metagenome]